MKTFVVILAVAAIASADIGLGYHYGPQKPLTSYETPSYTASSSSSGYNTGYSGQNTGVYKGQTTSTGLNSYQTPIGLQNGYPSQTLISTGAGYQGSGYPSGAGYQTGTGYQSGGYQSGAGYQSGTGYQSGSGYQTGTGYQTDNTRYQTGGNNAVASGSSGSHYQTSSSTGTLGSAPLQSGYQGNQFNQYQSSSQYESNANYQQYYNQVQQQPPQIFKHFYVHAAPEEPELPRPRQPTVLPAPQKHYKIIFIKTPSPAVGSTRFVPVQQQNEEKTIVYVLVKKPEAQEDIVVPPIEQKPPSKPEVYFIKYKGKEDSQNVINSIVNEYNTGKETVNVANAVHSTGTLDSISDVKYTAQSVGGSQSTGNNAGTTSQVLSGSYGSQYETSSGSVDQSFNSGSGNTGSSSSSFQSQSFESSTGYPSSTAGYPLSTGGYQVSTGAPIQVSSSSGGYDSVSSTTGSSASGGYNQVNTFSNQGVPHETYGPPKFRDNQ